MTATARRAVTLLAIGALALGVALSAPVLAEDDAGGFEAPGQAETEQRALRDGTCLADPDAREQRQAERAEERSERRAEREEHRAAHGDQRRGAGGEDREARQDGRGAHREARDAGREARHAEREAHHADGTCPHAGDPAEN